jgi:hypothetical protein
MARACKTVMVQRKCHSDLLSSTESKKIVREIYDLARELEKLEKES